MSAGNAGAFGGDSRLYAAPQITKSALRDAQWRAWLAVREPLQGVADDRRIADLTDRGEANWRRCEIRRRLASVLAVGIGIAVALLA